MCCIFLSNLSIYHFLVLNRSGKPSYFGLFFSVLSILRFLSVRLKRQLFVSQFCSAVFSTQDRSKRLKLLNFIADRAEQLFKPVGKEDVPEADINQALVDDEGGCNPEAVRLSVVKVRWSLL